MRIGVPKEIKNQEYRVGMIPATVQALVRFGHQVFIQKSAGEGSGISDDDYLRMGAQILPEAGDIFEQAGMIVKVKEPLASERIILRG